MEQETNSYAVYSTQIDFIVDVKLISCYKFIIPLLFNHNVNKCLIIIIIN